MRAATLRVVPLVLAAVPASILACRADESRSAPSAAVAPACGAEAWAFATEPFALSVCEGGTRISALEAARGSALWIESAGVRVDLVGPAAASREGDVTKLAYATSDGRQATIALGTGEEGTRRITFEVTPAGEDDHFGVDLPLGDGEGIYGLLELPVPGVDASDKTTQGLDLRGLTVDMVVEPTMGLYGPFVVSTSGYGLEVDSDWPGTWRIGEASAPDRIRIVQEGPRLELLVHPGPTPLEAQARYARRTGTTRVPPSWGFGHWRWRDQVWDLPNFHDGTPDPTPWNSMIVEDVLMMQALGIPNSIYLIDRPWGPGPFGFDDYAWEPTIVPEHASMIEWLASKQQRLALWVAPWASGPARQKAIDAGWVVRHERLGTERRASLIDLTNPEATAWYESNLAERVRDGVRAFKLDRGDEKPPDGLTAKGTYFDGRPYRAVRNVYPVLYQKAVASAFARGGAGEDWITIARAGFRGSARYTAFWGGDSLATEGGLRAAIVSLQRASILNYGIWGSDTCGYTGGPNAGGTADAEVCARWLAFSAFNPLMEVGPNGNAALWSRPKDGVTRGRVGPEGYGWEPYYDEELLAIWRLYARIHEKLVPHLRALAEASHRDGRPIVRPMAIAYPGVAAYRDLFEQFLVGPDLLVRALWKKGTSSVLVEIPEGTWIDAWTGRSVVGPTQIEVATPRHVVPVFVRAGGAIDLGDLEAAFRESVAAVKSKPDLGKLAGAETPGGAAR
jgi:alpha-glucosidase (family GH31 glycosyl hydrolase)